MAAVNEKPVSDSALTSLLEEFEEGTLLSLLDNNDFFSYLRNYPLSPNVEAEETADDDLDLSDLFGDDFVFPEFTSTHHRNDSQAVDYSGQQVPGEGRLLDTNSSNSLNSDMDDSQSVVTKLPLTPGGSETDVSNLDSNDSDTADDGSCINSGPVKRCKLDSSEQDRLFLSACVEHDHCYARAQQPQLLGDITDKDVLQIPSEEGNTSDAGTACTHACACT